MTDPDALPPPIADYGAIGDCRSAALVSKAGALEWLCMPRFESDALFAAVLDRERGGAFAVRPTGAYSTTRRYLPGTNVLESVHEAAGGRIRVIDCMPVASEAEKRGELLPEHEVLRRVEGLAGEVEVEVVFDPRPGYGETIPRIADRGDLGWFAERGKEALAFRTDLPASRDGDRPGVRGAGTVAAGDVRWAGFTYTDEDAAVVPLFGAVGERKIERSVRWWRGWLGGCRYEGPWRDAVLRSALAVKLLAYAPSGAVVAAPTTSLPERIGGVRNWDYRYCWLRDSSLTIQSLLDLGFEAEAHAFLSWMLHATRRSWPELQILYDVHGRQCPAERELGWLEGYRGSGPVRIGNGARSQFQLDVYGEVVDAVAEYVHRGGIVDRGTERMLRGLGRTVVDRWRQPDEGIWEVRVEPRHHTYSKVMAWVALQRLLELAEGGAIDLDGDDLARERDAIREVVEAEAWNASLGSYTSELGGDDVDASLLLLPRYGYADARSERMRGTFETIVERLGAGDGLLYRYRDQDDGLPAGEGAFGISSFWAVDCECRRGNVERASERFEALLGQASDLGLYAEEIDPETGEHLGNFPQAFTHVGLIDAALTLAEATGEATVHRTGHAEALDVEAS